MGGRELSKLMSPTEPKLWETVKAEHEGTISIACFDIVDANILCCTCTNRERETKRIESYVQRHGT